MTVVRRAWAFTALWAMACEAPVSVDLDGPEVVASSLGPGPRTVEVGTFPALEAQFSEPIARESASAGSVALLVWREVGRCDLDPSCAEGSCERGRCMEDPVRDSDLSALGRGDFFDDDATPIVVEVVDSDAGPSTLLRVVPQRALLHHARHSLVLGAGIRDESGAPLIDDTGEVGPWRRDFVTAGRGSSGPEATLVRPQHREGGVPTNISTVQTAFPLPVVAREDDVLELEAELGSPVLLAHPRPCGGWIDGFCLAWTPIDPLRPRTSYAPHEGTVRDVWGRAAVPPHARTLFGTADGDDTSAPGLGSVRARAHGGCVIVSLTTVEPVAVEVSAGAAVGFGHGSGSIEVGIVPEAPAVSPGASILTTVAVEDLAGNRASKTLDVIVDDSFAADVPDLAITELLANPLGKEPDQEMVELVSTGGAVDLDGLVLADASWAEVVAARAEGRVLGDVLPALSMAAGSVAVVVGDGYVSGEGDDPRPAPGTIMVRLDSSLAAGGLKNAGEALSLYRADPPALVSSYGNFVDTSKQAHAGISVVRTTPGACDVAASWRSHPLGTSTPGTLP